ncbi:MAG: hypothetical protein LBJ92_04380 [Holosporales bacterium]|nr:hypothetical protein [Holosporales bacterium]
MEMRMSVRLAAVFGMLSASVVAGEIDPLTGRKVIGRIIPHTDISPMESCSGLKGTPVRRTNGDWCFDVERARMVARSIGASSKNAVQIYTLILQDAPQLTLNDGKYPALAKIYIRSGSVELEPFVRLLTVMCRCFVSLEQDYQVQTVLIPMVINQIKQHKPTRGIQRR